MKRPDKNVLVWKKREPSPAENWNSRPRACKDPPRANSGERRLAGLCGIAVVRRKRIFRECFRKDYGIGNRYEYHNKHLKHLLFRRGLGFVCKGIESVNGGMSKDTGKQTAAAVKDRYKQEAHRNRKADLEQIAYHIHAAAIE